MVEGLSEVSPVGRESKATPPFRFMTATWITTWTGYTAEDLPSLLHGIRQVPSPSIYYHVHHAIFRRLKYTLAEYTNDFARWVLSALGQKGLAEKLSSVDPLEFFTVGQCRARLAAYIQEYVNEGEVFPRVPSGQEFYFLQTRSFVMPLGVEAQDVPELAEKVAQLPAGSLRYHFIEARFREGEDTNDFSRWLVLRGEEKKAEALKRLNPYLYDLQALREQILEILKG